MTIAFPNAAIVAPGPAGATAPSAIPSAPASRPARAGGPAGGPAAAGPSFAEVLARTDATRGPEFSRHALDRVARRGIAVDPPTLQRLGDGMSRAAAKGARNAVIFIDNTAFVANVPNHTVITAVDSEHLREQVFTNIDSAVIA